MKTESSDKSPEPHFGKTKTVAIIILLVAVVFLGSLLLWQNVFNKIEPVEQVKSEHSMIAIVESPRERTEVSIKTAVNAENYLALELLMAPTLDYSIASTDKAGKSATKDVVTGTIENYFGPEGYGPESPWNFKIMQEDSVFATRLNAMSSDRFSFTNAYVGVSRTGNMYMAFHINDDGQITSVNFGFAPIS